MIVKTAPVGGSSGRRTTRQNALVLVVWVGLMILALTGCTVSLIAPYDDATVNAVTDLLKRTDTFLIQQQTLIDTNQQAKTTYDANRAWYDETQVDLNAIVVRAEAIPKNQNTVTQLGLLQNAFNDLVAQNKQGFSKEYLVIAQKSVDQLIGAILAAEFAKKQH